MRIVIAVVVWVVVAIVLELLGQALGTGEGSEIGAFLAQNNILLGFLAGVIYYFFGPQDYRLR